MSKDLKTITIVYKRFLTETDNDELAKLRREMDQVVMKAIKEGANDWEIENAMDQAIKS